MDIQAFDYVQAFVMGIPAGVVLIRHLASIVNILNRSTAALERIADRLENADYVKLDNRGIREVK